ncbi:MAG: trypsin-like serine protease [Labilithrix sp.]|nr:trypsin-like serine protease [Labilithrix sp.]MCW5809917.1 trypsin-like serine protease [Labilithrix sp.]
MDPPLGEDEAAIINGVRDTGHPAVVALTITRPQSSGANTYSSCTGTIVQVNPATKVGYVMTAAHCVRGASTVSVIQGSDRTEAAKIITYAYIDHTVHPQYNGATTSPYDVAMIRVLGVDRTTPVVPILVPDGLRQGQRVTSVGFGRTVRPNVVTDAAANTAKNRIDGSIATLTNTEVGVRYDNNGDICQGDSGGPVLAVVNGKEYAVAVHSYVTGACVGIGYSVRAATYRTFFQGIIDQPAPEQTCEVCRKTVGSGTQVCGEARRACLADEQCNGLRLCLSKCSAQATDAGLLPDAGPIDECRKACSVEFPFGAAPYNTQLSFCSCNACESACAGDTACAAVPACGMTLVAAGTTPTADTCNTCMNGGCCAEQEACGKDGHCYRCARTPETPGCDDDVLYQRLMACKAASCSGECQ